MPDVEGLKAKITQPIGPLPAWGWVAAIVGGYFAFRFIKGRSGGSTATADTTAAGSAAPAGALDTSIEINNLTQSIKDLMNKIPGVTVPVTPITPAPTSNGGSSGGGGTIAKATAPVTKVPGLISQTLTKVPNPVDLAKDANPIFQNPDNAANTTFHKVVPGSSGVANEAFHTISGSNALQSLSVPAAPPQMPSNTAVQTAIHSINGVTANTPVADVAATRKSLSVPTIATQAKVPTASLTIPAMTPPKRSSIGTAAKKAI